MSCSAGCSTVIAPSFLHDAERLAPDLLHGLALAVQVHDVDMLDRRGTEHDGPLPAGLLVCFASEDFLGILWQLPVQRRTSRPFAFTTRCACFRVPALYCRRISSPCALG